MGFSPVYSNRVLNPSYSNWKRYFAQNAMSVHKAHLVMLSECGLIPPESVRAIRRGMDILEKELELPEDIPDGVEDLYFLFEQELRKRIGADHGGYLHTARSRNDMDTTVFRMTVLARLTDFLEALIACCDTAMIRARESKDALIVLYTHGQPANVSTLAHYLTAFLAEILEDARALCDAMEIVDRSTMGACAITTTGFNIDRRRVSDLLGLAQPVVNSYQAIATSHWLTRPAAACSALMSDITRFVADLGHKASCDVGIVIFPDDLVQVSSIMPQKRNPVIIEHIRIQAGLARGEFASVEELFRNVPYQDVNELADATVERLLAGLETAASCLDLLAETLRGIRVDDRQVAKVAIGSGATTTELADTMVRELEVSFRVAHSITQSFVRARYDKRALRTAFREATGSEFPYDDERIDDILSPRRFVEVRTVPGGPAPAGMEPVFDAADADLAAVKGRLHERRIRAAAAATALQKTYAELT